MFHLYGFLIGVGVVAGIGAATIQAKHFHVDPTIIENCLFWIAIPAILGARIYHLSTDWNLYSHSSFFSLISIWNGGLGYFGALIGGVTGLALYSRTYQYKKKELRKTRTFTFFLLLDLLSLGAPLAQMIGRFGNYFNQELYGLPTSYPWGIIIHGEKYHPLFAYEALGNFVIFMLVNWLAWKKYFALGKGQYAFVYVSLYAVLRFWLEFLRIETAHFNGSLSILSIAQWVSVCLATLAIGLFWLRRHADRGIEWELKTLV